MAMKSEKSEKVKNRTATNKQKMLAALRESLGVVSTAVDVVGINQDTHYDWYKKDAEYHAAVDLISERAIDIVESELFKKIKSGDTTSIIFFLKTRGKKRGYTEEQKINLEMIDYKLRFGE